MTAVSMQFDEKIIKEAVQEQMAAAIAAELMKVDKTIIDGLVQGVLNQKVDNEGKATAYSSNSSFLVWLVRKSIQEAAAVAIKKFVEDERPTLEKSIIKQLKAEPDKMARAFLDGLSESLKASWRFTVSLSDSK